MDYIKEKLHQLEYSFGKKIIFVLLLRQIILVLSDLYFVGTYYLVYDVVLILTIAPCYIFTLVSEHYDFQKIGKLMAVYLMILNITFNILYYEKFPAVICFTFIFPFIFSLFYSIKESIYLSLIFLLVIPLSFLYNSYFTQSAERSNVNYDNFSNTYTIISVFILFSVSFYYVSQIQKLRTVLHFIEKNTVAIAPFPGLEEQIIMKEMQKDCLEKLLPDVSIPFYEKLFSEIESHMSIQKPWRSPDYNLKQLARDVNSNTQYVSSAINTCYKSNFKSYLNDFRLNAFTALIRNRNEEEFSLEDAYLTIGFYNRSTFNRVFKSKFNMTPQEYINTKPDV